MKVTKQFEFEMAHLLAFHPSLCKNLHGHSYKLFVTAEGGVIDDMVLDFQDLKKLVKEHIVDPLDHCFAFDPNTLDPFEYELSQVVKQHGKKYFEFPFRTTCENMSKWMFDKLNSVLREFGAEYRISKITLYETSTSYCEYTGE